MLQPSRLPFVSKHPAAQRGSSTVMMVSIIALIVIALAALGWEWHESGSNLRSKGNHSEDAVGRATSAAPAPAASSEKSGGGKGGHHHKKKKSEA